MSRLRTLTREQRLAGVAALALIACMFLPWYRTSFTRGDPPVILHENRTAFGVFSWVEAAVLLVAAAVLYLLWARAQRRGFHLPGGDGWTITIAGGWVGFLLVWRLFDKPGVAQGSVGVQWGIFVTMVAGGLLAAAGQRLRAAHPAEPPNPAEDPTWEQPARRPREPGPARAPADHGAVTRVIERRPRWEDAPTRRLPDDEDSPTRRLDEPPPPPPPSPPPPPPPV